ncbi:MAG: hypothetical protein Q7S16_00760 [bacterium]|nr:hypothetical protein [bacterium]
MHTRKGGDRSIGAIWRVPLSRRLPAGRQVRGRAGTDSDRGRRSDGKASSES